MKKTFKKLRFMISSSFGAGLIFMVLSLAFHPSARVSASTMAVSDVSPTAITVPAVAVTEVSFTGSPVAITIPENDAYTIVSNEAIHVGDYQARLSLITPGAYTWNDETTEDQLIPWRITPKMITPPAALVTSYAFAFFDNYPIIEVYEGSQSTSQNQSQVGIYTWTIELIDPINTKFANTTQTAIDFTWEITPLIISEPAILITEFAFNGSLHEPDLVLDPGSKATVTQVSEVGLYTMQVELRDPANMLFTNGTNTAIEIDWHITPAIITVPAVGLTEFAFTGFLNEPDVFIYTGSAAVSEMVSEVGLYTYEVALDDPFNTRFSNGTNASILIPWSITRSVVSVPGIQVTRFAFTGDLNRPGLNIYEGSQGSSDLVSEVGIHTYLVELIDPENTIWSNGTTSAFSVTWEIYPLAAITKPSIGITTFGFSANDYIVDVTVYDETTLTGTTIASQAGVYTAYARVNHPEQIQFEDGTTEVAIEWRINPMIVSRPAVVITSFAFGDFIHEVGAFVAPGSSLLNGTAVAVGSYLATAKLDFPGNQTWPDGDTTPVSIPWEITPMIISTPSIGVTQFAFSGFDNHPDVQVYPGSTAVSDMASQVGIYTYTIELIDPINTIFSNGRTDPIDIPWEITPMIISTPSIGVTQFAFSGFDNRPDVQVYPGSTAVSDMASQVGIYTYTIELIDPINTIFSNGRTDPIDIRWEITPMLVEKPIISITSFAFTGEILGPPEFPQPITRDPIASTNVGIYTARYQTVDPDNIQFPDGSTIWDVSYSITQAIIDASTWQWNYQAAFDATGDVYRVELMNVPESIDIIYSDHQASKPGIYTARAEFVYDSIRYQLVNPPAPLTWQITIKETIDIPTPLPVLLTYNGEPQQPATPSIEGVLVSMTAQTNVGEYSYVLSLEDPNTTQWSDGSTTPKYFAFLIERLSQDVSGVELSHREWIGTPANLTLLNVPDLIQATFEINETPGQHTLDIEWQYDASNIDLVNIPTLTYTVYPEEVVLTTFEDPIDLFPGQSIRWMEVSQDNDYTELSNLLSESSWQLETLEVFTFEMDDETDIARSLTIRLQGNNNYAVYDGERWFMLESGASIEIGGIDLIATYTATPAPSNAWIWVVTIGAVITLGVSIVWIMVIKKR